MPLTGLEKDQLCKAVMSGFLISDLEELTSFKLNERLNNIVPTNVTLAHAVFLLIEWAENRGRTEELIQAIRMERPTNLAIQEVALQLLAPNPDCRLANELAAAITERITYCRSRNLKFRSRHILAVLLTLRGEFARTCFEVARKGYVSKLSQMVDAFLSRQDQKESERGFDQADVDEHSVVLRAFAIAKSEGAAVVDERHLFLAFLDSESSLSKRICNDLNASEHTRLREYTLHNRPGRVIGPTPDSLFDSPEEHHVQPDQF